MLYFCATNYLLILLIERNKSAKKVLPKFFEYERTFDDRVAYYTKIEYAFPKNVSIKNVNI